MYKVQRSASKRTWDIVDSTGDIVEGGFFSRQAATDACAEWNRGPAQSAYEPGRTGPAYFTTNTPDHE